MSEELTNPEKQPIPSRAQVLESLLTDPTNLELYLRWRAAREAQVERSDDPKEGLRLVIDAARLCAEARLYEAAREAFTQAIEQAQYEDPAAVTSLEEELDDLPQPS